MQEYLPYWAVYENRAMTNLQLSHTESPICAHGCEINLEDSIAHKRSANSPSTSTSLVITGGLNEDSKCGLSEMTSKDLKFLMKTGQRNPGYWLQRARNVQNRTWLLVNTVSACQTHVCYSLQWVISSFCSLPTKVNSVCISAKCQHVFVKPTSCSDNLNFPYVLLLDECDIPPRVAGNAENRWPLIPLVPSRCALMVLMIIVAADTDVSLSRTAAMSDWGRSYRLGLMPSHDHIDGKPNLVRINSILLEKAVADR